MYYSERTVIDLVKKAWKHKFSLCPGDHRAMALVAKLYRYRGIQVKFRYVGKFDDLPSDMSFYEIIKPRSSK